MSALMVGIDEIASETHRSEGWTYCLLPADAVPLLVKGISTIHTRGSPLIFHGKKFKGAHEHQYRDFLQLIRRIAETQSPTFLEFSLMDENWKAQFLPFIENLVEGSLVNAGIDDPRIQAGLSRTLPGLVALQRYLSHLGPDQVLTAEIDQDSVNRSLSAFARARGTRVAAANLLSALYNGHRTTLFPNSPTMVRGGVSVLRDSDSALVQAADVLGNFAMSYLRRELGFGSKKIALKAAIFEDVFGDALPREDLSDLATMVGSDVVLKTPGILRLTMHS